MNTQEIDVWLDTFKEYQPLVKASIPLLEEVGADLYPMFEKMVDASADLQLRFFNQLTTIHSTEQRGDLLTREEAIQVLVAVTSGVVKRGMSK